MSIRSGPILRSHVMYGCVAVLLAISFLVMIGCVTRHHVYITKVGDKCQIADKDGNIKFPAKRGDYIVWHNQLDVDTALNFPQHGRLFGVIRAIAYAEGELLELRILPDAQYETFQFEADCGMTVPPPEIIVTPPGGGP